MKDLKLLEKISFERLGGSKEELAAANMIKEEVEKLGVECHLEAFPIQFPINVKATLEVVSPTKEVLNVNGVGMCGSVEELEADFLYVENLDDVSLANAKGKIVMMNGFLGYAAYKKIYNAKAVGFICFNGSVYEEDIDIEERYLREKQYELGMIPGVTMTIHDAERLLRMNPTRVKMSLQSETEERNSHNVVATIPGESDEIVCFTAHYDSVRYSKGVYDNATGSLAILDILAYYTKHKPKRTLKFIWCGTEERGLCGSKAYVEAHKEELSSYKLNINIDMIGVVLGYDIAVATAENSVVSYIDFLSKEVGHPITSKQGVYPSDSTPFADAKVPAISFARSPATGGAQIHSKKDVIDFISVETFNKTVDFVIAFANRMIDAKTMPIPQTIPDNMVEELDKYLLRKESE